MMENEEPAIQGAGRAVECPRCKHTFKPAELLPLTEQEQMVLDAIRAIRRSPQSPVSAQLIADHLHYSAGWARKWLSSLKALGVVDLPRGRCSGWVEVGGVHLDALDKAA
jgi:methylphosphotriester-DNA--protein-cysteine methyltransferase